jgi:hypothetical protein
VVERTASPRRKEATAWSGDAELFGRGDPGERAGGNDSDAVASGPDRRPDPGGLGTPTPELLSYRATRLGNDTLQPVVHPAPDVSVVLRTAARLGHSDGDQLGIAFVAIWPICK